MRQEVKEDYIKNPKTGRLIKRGSRVYRKLINEKIIENECSNILYRVENPETMTEEEIIKDLEIAKKIISKKMKDPLYVAAIGTGCYKNMLVRKKKVPSLDNMRHLMAKASKEVYEKNKGKNLTIEEIEEELEKLLLNENDEKENSDKEYSE